MIITIKAREKKQNETEQTHLRVKTKVQPKSACPTDRIYFATSTFRHETRKIVLEKK